MEYLALPVSVAERLRKNVPYSSRAPQGQGSALTPPAEGPPGGPGGKGTFRKE
ncbi:hypothetical protein [Pyrobaculum sp.]|uniref:hypothetical protein n=1 Tax=Pyrobaculum sp. TaxID=2004705 RepID=UPI003182208C